MEPKFNINRPKISDEEIKQHQDFDKLVKQFKEQSLKKAQGDESWWSRGYIKYAAAIAGITVVCTITYKSLKDKTPNQHANETVTTQKAPLTETKKSGKNAFILEPSGSLKINYSSYKVSGNKGGTITHNTGSKIKVPKNAFVDKAGKEIVGDVTIEYREFHDAGDIILSGIPMKYDSLNRNYNLESAGMFDIRGYQNGQEVYIKPEKKLSVEMVSTNSDSRFNQYYLDTVARNWTCIQRDLPVSIDHKLHTIEPTSSNVAVPETPQMAALKRESDVAIPQAIDSIKSVYTTRIERLPRVAEPNKPVQARPGRPTFQIESNVDDFPELAGFENMLFEVGPENKNYTREMADITWSNVKIAVGPDPGKNYLMTLTYRQRKEQLIVYPVLSEKDLKKAQIVYNEKLQQYQLKLEKRQADEKRLLAEMEAKQAALLAQQLKKQEEYRLEQAKLRAKYDMLAMQDLEANANTLSSRTKAIRLFEIARFGIYNSDCARPDIGGQLIKPLFVAENNNPPEAQLVYYVDHAKNITISLSADNHFAFFTNPGADASICIFSGSQLFICNKAGFKEGMQTGTYTFKVKALDRSVDLIDFKKALEI